MIAAPGKFSKRSDPFVSGGIAGMFLAARPIFGK
jgi:hypothetical protein